MHDHSYKLNYKFTNKRFFLYLDFHTMSGWESVRESYNTVVIFCIKLEEDDRGWR
jgi:hypothetical protein